MTYVPLPVKAVPLTVTAPVFSSTVTSAGSSTLASAGTVALISAGISASLAVAKVVPSGAVVSLPAASVNVGVTGAVSLPIVPSTSL